MTHNAKKPEFLIDELENIFRMAADAFNRKLIKDNAEIAHLFEGMSNLEKANYFRSILVGCIADYLSGTDIATLQHPYNMCGVVVQEEWFARIVKVPDLLEEDDPPRHPKALQKLIFRALHEDKTEAPETQLQLAGFEYEVDTAPPTIELGSLNQGVIGYVVDHNGLLAAFIFAEYIEDGAKLQKIYTLDLNSGPSAGISLPSPEFDPSSPSTTIKIKPEFKKTQQHKDEA